MFRGKVLAFLSAAYRKRKLRLFSALRGLQRPGEFDRFIRQLGSRDWVVYVRRPFAGPEHVIKYLARYTHRVAISNGRLISLQDGQVTFRWRDSADANRQKLQTIDAVEFIRRFLLHVLPRGFVKIRHFGFLANRNRREALVLCRSLLAGSPPQPPRAQAQPAIPERKCAVCKVGSLHVVERISAKDLITRKASPCPSNTS